MFRILQAEWLAPKVRRIEVEAPRVAVRHRPGHFVIVRVYDGGERIPLTIAASSPVRGAITLVVQVIGATTERLCALGANDGIADVVGPLGKPTELAHFGHVVLVGGGVGTAVIYPQAERARGAGQPGHGGHRRPLAAVRDPGGGASGRLRLRSTRARTTAATATTVSSPASSASSSTTPTIPFRS